MTFDSLKVYFQLFSFIALEPFSDTIQALKYRELELLKLKVFLRLWKVF